MLNEWTNLDNSHHQHDFTAIKMSRNYYCIDCKISTRNPRIYLEHRRDFHHDSITIHRCTLCVYASKHSQKLTRHVRTVHRNVIQSAVARPIGQPHRFGQSSNLNEPQFVPAMQGDKSVRISTCKLCGLYTANKAILMQHIRSEHPETHIYKCDQCEYSHYIRDRYNRHHRYHSMDYVRCKLCEFQTIYRWNLERHVRHHTNGVSLGFRCKKCNFTASTKQSITAHEIAHHSGLNELSSSSAMNATIMDSTPITQTEANDNSNHDDDDDDDDDDDANDVDGTSDFDASDFLELVFDTSAKPKLANSFNVIPSTVTVPQENAVAQPKPQQQQNISKTKFYYCVNCRFRNEIDWSQWTTDELPKICPSIKLPPIQQAVNSRYRCGYCHQASNWKHVIERHCRLVHNTSALIEKFSEEHKLFQRYKPAKRRQDGPMETATSTTKRIKSELDESAATHTEQYDGSETI